MRAVASKVSRALYGSVQQYTFVYAAAVYFGIPTSAQSPVYPLLASFSGCSRPAGGDQTIDDP